MYLTVRYKASVLSYEKFSRGNVNEKDEWWKYAK